MTQGDKSKGERGSYSNTDRLNGDLSAKKIPSKAKQKLAEAREIERL